jgi:hypothetical protein
VRAKIKGRVRCLQTHRNADKVSKQKGAKFPSDWDFIMQKMNEARKALEKDPYTPTPATTICST